MTVEQYKNPVQQFGIENNEAEIFNEYRCVHPGPQGQVNWNERVHFRCARVGCPSVVSCDEYMYTQPSVCDGLSIVNVKYFEVQKYIILFMLFLSIRLWQHRNFRIQYFLI